MSDLKEVNNNWPEPSQLTFCPYRLLELYAVREQLEVKGLIDMEEVDLVKLIKTKFRRLSLNCHPDRFPDRPDKHEAFIQLKLASDMLLDEHYRRKYNKHVQARHW